MIRRQSLPEFSNYLTREYSATSVSSNNLHIGHLVRDVESLNESVRQQNHKIKNMLSLLQLHDASASAKPVSTTNQFNFAEQLEEEDSLTIKAKMDHHDSHANNSHKNSKSVSSRNSRICSESRQQTLRDSQYNSKIQDSVGKTRKQEAYSRVEWGRHPNIDRGGCWKLKRTCKMRAFLRKQP